ncbi:MAG: hypothetical protein ACYDCM_04500 [Candidatus Acidiferrales bacterium]
MSIIRGQSAAVVAALFLALQTAAAQTYHYPLHSEAIRDAYFLGERNNFQTTDCLLQYIHRFTGPQAGRYYISQIEVSTPYQQIVLRGQRDTPGDSVMQAETDLQARPLKFIVRVRLEWNGSYADRVRTSVARPDLSRGVSIQVIQEHEIAPLKVSHQALYSSMGRSGSIFVGVLFELQFDPAKIDSAPLRISVKTPDGHAEEAEFDMAKIQ